MKLVARSSLTTKVAEQARLSWVRGAQSCLLAGIGVALLLNCGCGSGQTGSKISIGAVFPLTGDIASYGTAAKRGIDLAADELNGTGGVAGKRLDVVYEDDQGQANQAVAAMQKLVSINKVPAVLGSAASSVTLALCPLANRNKVVLITPISSSAELTSKGGPYFFRVCPSDVVQAKMMADWFKEDGRHKAAILYVNNSWGQSLHEEFAADFRANGGEIVEEETCRDGDRDMRAQLTKIKAAAPDALYGITQGREGGVILLQSRELGFGKPIYGADVWGSPELVETAKDAANGVRIIVPAKFEGPTYAAFAAAFQKKYGQQPDTYAAYSYDMTRILAAALAKSPGTDGLRQALASTSYEGVTGLTKFDSHGDVVGEGFQRKVLP